MLPPEDQVNCVAVPPPPDWWVNESQLYVDRLGYFDAGHLKRGWLSADFLVKEIEATLNRGGGVFQNPAISRKWNRLKNEWEIVYLVFYSISAQVPKDRNGRFDRDHILGLAYGIYMDFELGYEAYQKSKFPYLSGFAPADLPSDHLGFWAYMSGYEQNEIPSLLECLGTVDVLGGKFSSVVFDTYGIAENHEFSPMIMETVGFGRFKSYRTRNIPWPAFLEIQPIPSGPNTWQRGEDWHK
jgi:hypothetical protein